MSVAALPATEIPSATTPETASASPRRLKTVATLLALGLAAPLNAALALPVWLAGSLLPSRARAEGGRTVLVSGGKMTKALQIARAFHAAGHRVILAETRGYRLTGHRFSRAVDRFAVVPDPTDPGYAGALVDLVREHGVDLYVPVCSPVASHHDSLAMPALAPHCEVVHVAPDRIDAVDDKFRFSELVRGIGLRAPKSIRITDPSQIEAHDWSGETRPFILKSIAYDAIRRLDLTPLPRPTPEETSRFVRGLPISEGNPWVMQEYIEGTEYCTHGTLRDGRLLVHVACESSPFQINYAHLPRADIREWVERFAAETGLTGQVSFDFIEAADDGELYAIECNPRTHSAITLFKDQPGLPEAYLGEREADGPLEPAPGARPTYWLYHEVFRLLRGLLPGRDPDMPGFRERLSLIARGRDAVWSWRDPLPFLMLHHVHIPSLLLRDLREGRGWTRIDFNIGKLVQEGGD